MVIATPFGSFMGMTRVEYTVIEHPKIEQWSKDTLHGVRTRFGTDAQLPSGENVTASVKRTWSGGPLSGPGSESG